jgi:hypothetical protein
MGSREMSWLAVLLHLFALGTVTAIALVPFREIGRYYFRFHATIALVLAAFAVLLGRPWERLVAGPAPGRIAAAGALVFAVSVLVQSVVVRAVREDLRRDALLFPASVGLPFAALVAFAETPHGVGETALLAFHLWTSAAVLGTSLVAMTTGHWYLANAALSFDILRRLTGAFVLALTAKWIPSFLYAWLNADRYGDLEDFDKLVMGVRMGAGIVLAYALAFMAHACAKRRSNQSATGILYVGVVFVLIGEVISMYLTLEKRWPI